MLGRLVLTALIVCPSLLAQWAAGDVNLRYGDSYLGLPRHDGKYTDRITLSGFASYDPTSWLDFRIEADNLRSLKAPGTPRLTGVGDVSIGAKEGFDFGTTARIEVDYRLKLPAASAKKGLGTRRYDHRFGIAVRHRFQNTFWTIEGDMFGFISGLPTGNGQKTFTGYAASALYTPKWDGHTVTFSNEVDFIPANNNLPWEAYWLPGATIPFPAKQKTSKGAWSMGLTGRLGLTPFSPTGGFTITVKYRRVK